MSNRINILLALKANSNKKIWEIKIFNEFLNEKFSIDELYFFLQCRNQLFHGPQLELKGAFTEVIPKVFSERLEQVIEQIDVFDNDEEKKKIQQRIRMNYKDNDKVLVDAYEVY